MKIDMVIFPMHDWIKCEKEGFRTRDAHFIQHFEKSEKVGKILVVDRPTSLPELILKRRSWRVRNGKVIKRPPFSFLAQVSEKIYVLDIFTGQLIRPLVLRRDWWDYIFRRDGIIRRIKDSISFLGLTNIILFLWSPMSTGVICKLGEQLVVFDTLDNWTRHPEMKDRHGLISNGYNTIIKKADVIFANSRETQKFLSNSRVNPVLILNGVDKEFFSVKENIVPEDIKNIPKPIVGYAGKVGKRINVDIIKFISQKLPEVNFVFIGPFLDKKWINKLLRYKNIYFLGDKNYKELPYYLNNFDICIIPHNVGALENEGDPIKLYEYLAAGKPVVTTSIAGVDLFGNYIKICKDGKEFLEGITYYLEKIKSDGSLSDKLKNIIKKEYTWAEKTKIIIDKIFSAIEKAEKG